MKWTGPREGEIDSSGRLLADVPPERFPWCEASEHDFACGLVIAHGAKGSYCDCPASCADDDGTIHRADGTVDVLPAQG